MQLDVAHPKKRKSDFSQGPLRCCSTKSGRINNNKDKETLRRKGLLWDGTFSLVIKLPLMVGFRYLCIWTVIQPDFHAWVSIGSTISQKSLPSSIPLGSPQSETSAVSNFTFILASHGVMSYRFHSECSLLVSASKWIYSHWSNQRLVPHSALFTF